MTTYKSYKEFTEAVVQNGGVCPEIKKCMVVSQGVPCEDGYYCLEDEQRECLGTHCPALRDIRMENQSLTFQQRAKIMLKEYELSLSVKDLK